MGKCAYLFVNAPADCEVVEALCDVVEEVLPRPLHQLLANGEHLVVHLEPNANSHTIIPFFLKKK